MNDKKILFFDIDGTLLTPHPFKVPESTSRALTKPMKTVIFFSSTPAAPK